MDNINAQERLNAYRANAARQERTQKRFLISVVIILIAYTAMFCGTILGISHMNNRNEESANAEEVVQEWEETESEK